VSAYSVSTGWCLSVTHSHVAVIEGEIAVGKEALCGRQAAEQGDDILVYADADRLYFVSRFFEVHVRFDPVVPKTISPQLSV
jgi:hypothetical protein